MHVVICNHNAFYSVVCGGRSKLNGKKNKLGFFFWCHKGFDFTGFYALLLVSLYVALPVSPGSEELEPSVSISFSSSNGIPAVKNKEIQKCLTHYLQLMQYFSQDR